MPKYERPPIIEAVIDFRFEVPISDRDMERLRDAYKKEFPTVQDRYKIAVKVEGAKITPSMSLEGYQMNAGNGVDAVLIGLASFTTVRFAPYVSWDEFSSKARNNFEYYLSILARPKISRIATRFINRIDIPSEQINGKELSGFFAIGTEIPDGLVRDVSQFNATATVRESETGFAANIRCGTTGAVLIDRDSFVVDVDVYSDTNIPLKMDDLWQEVDKLRIAKNNLFEAAITNRVRELFK